MTSPDDDQREAHRALQVYQAAGYVPGHDGVVSTPGRGGGTIVLLADGRVGRWRQAALPVPFAGQWQMVRGLDWRDAVGIPGSPLQWKERDDDPRA